MRTEFTQSPDEVKDKTGSEVCTRPAWGLGGPHSLPADAEWVREKGLEDGPHPAGFWERKILDCFLSEYSNSGRILLSGPLTFRKERGGTNEMVSKREKDNKHTHSWKNKTLPQKALMEMYLSLKTRRGLACRWGPGHAMTRSVTFSLAPCLCAWWAFGAWRETVQFGSVVEEGREPISRDGLDPTVCSCG